MVSVLIVEDSEYIRSLIREILEENGHTIIGEAKSGDEGIEMYSIYKPELITMDLIMPKSKINGLEAIKQILKINPMVKIVVITALTHRTIAEEALKLGAANYIPKPFSIDELTGVIAKTLA